MGHYEKYCQNMFYLAAAKGAAAKGAAAKGAAAKGAAAKGAAAKGRRHRRGLRRPLAQ